VMLPGMMANVLPWPALSTRRPSRSSGPRHLCRPTRDDDFDAFMEALLGPEFREI
jgi:hypothetical protein